MDNFELDNTILDSSEFSLEAILAEYEAEETAGSQQTAARERAREIVMEALSDTIVAGRIETGDPDYGEEVIAAADPSVAVDEALNELSAHEQAQPAPEYEPGLSMREELELGILGVGEDYLTADEPETDAAPDEGGVPAADGSAQAEASAESDAEADDGEPVGSDAAEPEPPKPRFRIFDLRDGGSIPEEYASPGDYSEPEPEPETETEAAADTAPQAEPDGEQSRRVLHVAEDAQENEADAPFSFWGERGKPKSGFFDAVMAPILMLAAMVAVKGKARVRAQADRSYTTRPELSPAKAAAHYGKQAVSLRQRTRLAFFLCFFLLFIAYFRSWGWRLPGALAATSGASLVSMILLMAVMLVGLDVFTAGITSLFRGAPGAETLVSLSCIIALADALPAAAAKAGYGMPYCAVAGLSMAFALLGSRMTCSGLTMGFRTAASTKSPGVVTSERDIAGGENALLRTDNASIAGFVRRSEEPDLSEDFYRAATPFMLVAALVLAALAALVSDAPFLHTLSALLAVSASFSALLAFPLPFSLTASHLRKSGAAIAGCSGCSDIGDSRRVLITDTDLFPAGNLSISAVNILEGTFTGKVVSYTGSLLAASGSGLAAPFVDRIREDGYSMQPVEDFEIREGGGLYAMIRGEATLVGSSGFMNLMGIRLPHSLTAKNAVFTAVEGTLVGVFTMNYMPQGSVQDALISLLHGACEPLFAVRDFNITPLMIRQKFKLPTERFDFPSYEERYRISSAKRGEDSQIAAVLSLAGLGPTVEAADRGKRLQRSAKLCTGLSAAGSFIGMALMFLILRSGDMGAASVGNMLTYMLLWLTPVVVVSFGMCH